MAENKNELICDSVSEDIIKIAGEIAMRDGARNVTVRQILRAMGVTNRVFYNRFRNIGEVLQIVHRRTVYKMRENIKSEYDMSADVFAYVTDIAVKILLSTYDLKNQFSQYSFETDSYSGENFSWWMTQIKKIIEVAKSTRQIRPDIDADNLSYTVWCFFRGYNNDAVNRGLSKEEAVKRFMFGLNCIFDGIR